MALTESELIRYSRQTILPEIGVDGQAKLNSARVLLIGVGGLGSPAALYLAAAGIGLIGIVENDVVDASNLHRQVLYTTDAIGQSKGEEAQARLTQLNPSIKVVHHPERLTGSNALEIFAGYDLVLDGSDNFATRYLVNDASIISGIPNVFGAIDKFTGQATIFGLGDGPCYRCIYPEPPSPGAVPSCAEAGVLGVLPGMIGMIQATEAIKVILVIGDTLKGRLLSYDALAMRFGELRFQRDPRCPMCGDAPTITTLVDYELFCNPKSSGLHNDISVRAYAAERESRDHILLDVREIREYNSANLGGLLIPLSELSERYHELPYDRDIIVHCERGQRSQRAIEILKKHGYTRLQNLTGGIAAWFEEIGPDVRRR